MTSDHDLGEVICVCRGITRGQIQSAIARQDGLRLADLTATLGAGAECGSCSAALLDMLGEPSAWTPVTASRHVLSEDAGDERRIELIDLQLPDGARYPPTRAGQYVTVQGLIDGRWVSRSYTIINPSPQPRVIRIAVRRIPGGVFTPWLLDPVHRPQPLRIGAPGGVDFWSAGATAPVVCMVGGIGVTLGQSLLAQRPPGTRFHLDCTARTRADLVFQAQHAALSAHDPDFTFTCRSNDIEGILTRQAVQTTMYRFPDARYVLCGPPSYISAVYGWLIAAGVDGQRIHVERFFLQPAKPLVRRSWKNYGYRLGVGLALLPALWLLPGLTSMVPHHQHNPGHQDLACQDCHRSAPGTMRQQLQAKVDYWLGRSEIKSAFVFKAVNNRVCLDCHNRADDHHPSHRFLEPRFAEVRATLGPQLCISCHREHHKRRLTLTDTGFCASCHAALTLKQDAITPTHASLIKAQRWQTCLGCHDFHNNHGWKAPTQLDAAISLQRIHDYFVTGSSPYGEVVQKARKSLAEPVSKPQEAP
jgi:ferredoxin-NADP reductase/bacterioferritin-associated ferredoxin